jgi:hypothetical protein
VRPPDSLDPVAEIRRRFTNQDNQNDDDLNGRYGERQYVAPAENEQCSIAAAPCSRK